MKSDFASNEWDSWAFGGEDVWLWGATDFETFPIPQFLLTFQLFKRESIRLTARLFQLSKDILGGTLYTSFLAPLNIIPSSWVRELDQLFFRNTDMTGHTISIAI